MTLTRRRFPESFKREVVDQVLADASLRHVAEALGIAECLLGEWKRQYEQQDDDAFPDDGKQRMRVRSFGVYASSWRRSPWSTMN